MNTFHRAGVIALVVGMLWLPTTPIHAQSFSQADISEQNRAVLVAAVGTLEQHLKLLQMLFINQLEARIDVLEAQLANT